MANIEMNVLKVGNSEFEIADAKARQDVSDLKEDFSDLGLSVVDGKINITYEEVSA